MSGGNGLHFESTKMIIPGGLKFKAKVYYLLEGKLPPSVYDRWIPCNEIYIAQKGDQVVTVNKADNYIGSIIEKLHDAITGESFDGDDTILSDDMVNDINSSLSTSDDGKQFDDVLEFFKHIL